MRTVSRVLVTAVFLVGFILPSISFAQDYSAMVVQNRKYSPTHEFGFAVGLLPLDAFTKGATVSGSYTLHFSESWAWEVGQFYYSLQYDTDLTDDLAALDIAPTPFEIVDFFATSNVVWKPLYWKGSWLNDTITYGELFLSAGGGYGWLTRSKRPALDIGGGFRMYTGEFISLRFDMRYLAFIGDQILEDFDVKDELWIGFGTSLSF